MSTLHHWSGGSVIVPRSMEESLLTDVTAYHGTSCLDATKHWTCDPVFGVFFSYSVSVVIRGFWLLLLCLSRFPRLATLVSTLPLCPLSVVSPSQCLVCVFVVVSCFFDSPMSCVSASRFSSPCCVFPAVLSSCFPSPRYSLVYLSPVFSPHRTSSCIVNLAVFLVSKWFSLIFMFRVLVCFYEWFSQQ